MTRLDFKALTATNRLVAQSDTTGDDPGSDQMRYDKAGNLVWDNFSPASGQRGSMTYDAENHMVTAVNGTQRYRYDASGRRVKRLVGQTGANGEVWQVYSPEGELLAEYPKQGAASAPVKEYGYRDGQMLVVFDSTETGDDQLRWLVTDHLGSTRMIVNKSGSLSGMKRRDYLPFGEELAASVGHRAASGSGYQLDDKPRIKFGAKERDNETGLDYFINRYFSSIQGRFTSADPVPMTTQRPPDPQRLNLYAYVRNNPLIYTDPNGLELYFDLTFDSNGKVTNLDDAKKYKKYLEKATGLKLNLNKQTGEITIKTRPSNLSATGVRIETIINDSSNRVTIGASNNSPNVLIGQFNGGGSQTIDFADVKKVSEGLFSKKGGITKESVVAHETTEAYEALVNPAGGFPGAHQAAIGFENDVRARQNRGARIGESATGSGNDFVIEIDYTTHIERITVDGNRPGDIKKVEVKKKP